MGASLPLCRTLLLTCSPADNLPWPSPVQEVVILLKKISVAPAPPAAKSVATATAQVSAGCTAAPEAVHAEHSCSSEHSHPSWDPDALRDFDAILAAASFHLLAVARLQHPRVGLTAFCV